jgi:hypothetical protein
VQPSRRRRALQLSLAASAAGTNATSDVSSAMAAQERVANADVACFLKWQPRYRGPRGRQTGSFASPPFDGFAAFHFEGTIDGIGGANNGAQSPERDMNIITGAGYLRYGNPLIAAGRPHRNPCA